MKLDPRELPDVPTIQAELALEHTAYLGESPLWDEREQVLYWVNIKAGEIHRFDPATGRDTFHKVDSSVSSLVRRARGGLAVTLHKNFAFYDPATGAVEILDTVEGDRPEHRFNDGKADRQGRYWAGTMNQVNVGRPEAALYRFDGPGRVSRHVSEVIVSNGIGWSPDNRTLYYIDTLRYAVEAFDFDADSGTLNNRRPFLQIPPESRGLLDGLTVDAEGGVWCAVWNFGCLLRLDPEGKLERVVRFPTTQGTSCAFGGADYGDLYITTAREGMNEAAVAKQPLTGSLFRCRPGVVGLPEPLFAA